MPTRSGDELLAHLEKLCAEYRIVFANDINPLHWPASHRKVFENAKLLGTKTIDEFAPESIDSENEPWKVEVRFRAMLLTKKAARQMKRNESTWRHACEPIILGRLESEVCCKICRKRLWRSDVEVIREGDSAAARRLEVRQRARKPCRCPRIARSTDHLEAIGLNPIFNYRADEEVLHAGDIARRLDKGERPDRVYGLRQTRNIENLLYDAAKRQFQDDHAVEKQVHEVLGLDQPLRQTGDCILFPFLVLEAKSGHASYSWHSIQLQTAFSVRTLLERQGLLQRAAGAQSKWKTGPLVWFLASKGEDWRLYAAYMQPVSTMVHRHGTIEYKIINIWNGSVTTRDGALQLLLLIDYIFDWARDIYREDIIRELRIFASGSNDTASAFYTDPDIFSTLQTDPLDPPREPNDEAMVFQEQDPFTAMDSPAGVVRHASFVEAKYCCIFVTRDNVQTLLQSVKQNKLVTLCRQILTEMQDSFLLTLPTLDAIERQWTGQSRLSSYRPDAARFFTAMTCTTYISSSWHPIRELFAIAIAEDAWSDFVAASRLKLDRGKTKTQLWGEIQEDAILPNVKQLQAGSSIQALHAAILRRAVKFSWSLRGQTRIREGNGELRRIVHFVYEYFQKGNLEPQEPFLRVSKRMDQQHLRSRAAEPAYFDESAHASSRGCVLVTATCYPESSRSNTQVCAYLTSGEPELSVVQELASIVRTAFETCDIYHTTRNHWSSPLSPLKRLDPTYRNIWNLQRTYGVCSRHFDFLNLIRALDSEAPITQGSSQALTASGSQLYQRNFETWDDPRLLYMDRKERMFVLYKLFSREIQFWKTTAIERRAQGQSCCGYCAAIGEHDVCDACEDLLMDRSQYSWLINCLEGGRTFTITPLTGPDLQERFSRSQNHDLALKEFIWNHRFSGPTDDDEDWSWNLDFYADLEDPFHDIEGLREQWRVYKTFCDWSHRWPFRTSGTNKRLRDSDSEDDNTLEELHDEDVESQDDDSLNELHDGDAESEDDDSLNELHDEDSEQGLDLNLDQIAAQ